MLQGLRLHRPNNSKPNSRRNESTHILIQEQMAVPAAVSSRRRATQPNTGAVWANGSGGRASPKALSATTSNDCP